MSYWQKRIAWSKAHKDAEEWAEYEKRRECEELWKSYEANELPPPPKQEIYVGYTDLEAILCDYIENTYGRWSGKMLDITVINGAVIWSELPRQTGVTVTIETPA